MAHYGSKTDMTLALISKTPGLSPTEIANILGHKPNTVTVRLKDMHDRGLVKRISGGVKGYLYYLPNYVFTTKGEPRVTDTPRDIEAKDTSSGDIVIQRRRTIEVPPQKEGIQVNGLVDLFVNQLADAIVGKLRPMLVERLTAEVRGITSEVAEKAVEPSAQSKVKLPRILVCGVLNEQGKMLEAEFKDVLDLRFVTKDDTLHKWKSQAANAEAVYAMAGFISHAAIEAIKSVGVKPIAIHGGMTSIRETLLKLAVE